MIGAEERKDNATENLRQRALEEKQSLNILSALLNCITVFAAGAVRVEGKA